MSTLFLATTGGHLAQLDYLKSRMGDDGPSVWVTHANPQSTSLLADRVVEYVPYVGVRDVRGVLRCLPSARRLRRRHQLTRAVSTGSGIALGYLPYLATCGVECHFVESAARVAGPSLTGRLLAGVPGVRTYTQYPHLADGRWRYGGSVFDGYAPEPAPERTRNRLRVVVTVGTATEFPFRRLLEPLVGLLAQEGELARRTGLPVEVCWQVGATPVADLPIRAVPFLPAADLAAALAAADVVVSHSGTGSALAALEAGRCPLLVPRLRRFGEAGEDHQVQLAAELTRRGLARHGDAGEITVEDLLAVLAWSVRPVPAPRQFTLAAS